MKTLVVKILESWKFHRGLSLDILNSLTDEQLNLTVGKNMGTLGEQFRHMGRVQFQYSEAIESLKIQDVKEKIDPKIARSKEQLVEFLKTADHKMEHILNGLEDKEVQDMKIDWTHWGIESMNLFDHLEALKDHENLHNGQIVVYMRTHDLKFPDSWKAWGF